MCSLESTISCAKLRLASLAADPEAFASTYAEDAGEPTERWQWWAAQSEDGRTQRTFVLVADDGRWLGLALVRLDGDKAGSAVLNAMWIAPEAGAVVRRACCARRVRNGQPSAAAVS